MPFGFRNEEENSISRPDETRSSFRDTASALMRRGGGNNLLKYGALAAAAVLGGWMILHGIRAKNDRDKAEADAAAAARAPKVVRPFYKEPERTPWTYAVVGPEGLDVSYTPDIGSHVIEKLPAGMKLIVNGDSGGWKHVVEDAPFQYHDGWITPGDAQNPERLKKAEPPAPKPGKTSPAAKLH